LAYIAGSLFLGVAGAFVLTNSLVDGWTTGLFGERSDRELLFLFVGIAATISAVSFGVAVWYEWLGGQKRSRARFERNYERKLHELRFGSPKGKEPVD
jgi:hypothetical protein